MPERLKNSKKVVGTRKLIKALERDAVSTVFLAADADMFITGKVRDLCAARNVTVTEVSDIRTLGDLCDVDVPTASAGLLKETETSLITSIGLRKWI